MDSHEPIDIIKELKKLDINTTYKPTGSLVFTMYDKEVCFTVQQLGRFFLGQLVQQIKFQANLKP